MSAPELAPSETRAEEFTVVRVLGFVGLGLALLGIIAIIANEYGPRMVGRVGGYFLATVGIALLLFHALKDSDVEFRRAYAWLAYVLLFLFALTGILVLAGSESTTYALRLGGVPVLAGAGAIFPVLLGILGLAFLVAPLRHETNANQRAVSQLVLLLFGGVLVLGTVGFGLASREMLLGPGVVTAILGTAFLVAFLTQAGATDGLGHFVATMLGVLGTLTLAYALAMSIWPTVLYDGPGALRNSLQLNDPWRIAARTGAILVCLGIAALAWRSKSATVLGRVLFAGIGVVFAGVFLTGTFTQVLTESPKGYLVPYGLILALIGVIFLGTSMLYVSESAFVALVKRELAAFVVSPIVYFILFGSAIVAAYGHLEFIGILLRNDVQEPIVQYNPSLLQYAAFTTLFMVPALTMRTLSEEKRTGTLEVLLTSPVSETGIVLSKFLAPWLVYLLTFLPAVLFLIALRFEGNSFDYRPLLSYLLAIAVSGVAFIGMGLFFSSLTANQIVSGMFTFVGMFGLLLSVRNRQSEFLGGSLQAVLAQFDYLTLWADALQGQVSVSQCAAFVALGVFWLFLTVKVLEARKWG